MKLWCNADTEEQASRSGAFQSPIEKPNRAGGVPTKRGAARGKFWVGDWKAPLLEVSSESQPKWRRGWRWMWRWRNRRREG